jgi:hypothetical protein
MAGPGVMITPARMKIKDRIQQLQNRIEITLLRFILASHVVVRQFLFTTKGRTKGMPSAEREDVLYQPIDRQYDTEWVAGAKDFIICRAFCRMLI